MRRSTGQHLLLQPRYRGRVAVAVAGLSAAMLIGAVLFCDSTFVRRSPDSRKFVDAVLGVSCQVAFWPSLVFLLLTFRSAAREAGSLELCPTCGYDLRASPDRCPECGTIKVSSTDAAGPSVSNQ